MAGQYFLLQDALRSSPGTTIQPFIRIYSDSSTLVDISGVVVSYFFHEQVLPVSFGHNLSRIGSAMHRLTLNGTRSWKR